MLAKQLLHEEKKQKAGEAFALRAWQNFPTLPPWCREYIEEFLARGNEKDSFWALLASDPVYRSTQNSWRMKVFGKGSSMKDEDIASVLVVFKHCAKETGPENMFDPLLEKISGPIDEFVALVKREFKDRKERQNRSRESEERNRGRRRRRSSSRSGSRDSYEDIPPTAPDTDTRKERDARKARASRRDEEDEDLVQSGTDPGPELGFVQYGTDPIYEAQNGDAPVDSDQSSGIEPLDLHESEEGLMEKIMVLYTGLPPSYSEDEGWAPVAEEMGDEGGETDPPDLEAQWPYVEEIE